MKNTLGFWRALAIVLLIMTLVELGALWSSVVKLEGYCELTNQLRNEIAALKHHTNYVK